MLLCPKEQLASSTGPARCGILDHGALTGLEASPAGLAAEQQMLFSLTEGQTASLRQNAAKAPGTFSQSRGPLLAKILYQFPAFS